jgi:hypothetical protein
MGLQFEDSWGGSAKAEVDGATYHIIPVALGYEPRRSEVDVWVWSGDAGTAEDAISQANKHHQASTKSGDAP